MEKSIAQLVRNFTTKLIDLYKENLVKDAIKLTSTVPSSNPNLKCKQSLRYKNISAKNHTTTAKILTLAYLQYPINI